MRFFEAYRSCGCTSKQSSKRDLTGYCDTHGNEPAQVFRANGFVVWDWRQHAPADHPAKRRAIFEATRSRVKP